MMFTAVEIYITIYNYSMVAKKGTGMVCHLFNSQGGKALKCLTLKLNHPCMTGIFRRQNDNNNDSMVGQI